MHKSIKLRMSYSGNTLAFQAKARGSIPLIRLFSQSIGFRVSRWDTKRGHFLLCPRFAPDVDTGIFTLYKLHSIVNVVSSN